MFRFSLILSNAYFLKINIRMKICIDLEKEIFKSSIQFKYYQALVFLSIRGSIVFSFKLTAFFRADLSKFSTYPPLISPFSSFTISLPLLLIMFLSHSLCKLLHGI